MARRPTAASKAQEKTQERATEARVLVAVAAAGRVAAGNGDDLVVLPKRCDFSGPMVRAGVAQDDDGVVCAAAVDVLRWLVAEYEERR